MYASSSASPRVALPADISDSVNYLQSFIQSQSSSVDHHHAESDRASRHTPAVSSLPARWSSASDGWSQSRPYTRPNMTTTTTPLREKQRSFSFAESNHSQYADARAGLSLHTTPLRYGWQRPESSARTFGNDGYRGTSSYLGSGWERSSLTGSEQRGRYDSSVVSSWRPHTASPMRLRTDRDGSQANLGSVYHRQGESPEQRRPRASTTYPLQSSSPSLQPYRRDDNRRQPQQTPSSSPHPRDRPTTAPPRERFLAKDPPAQSQSVPYALPPRAPSSCSRPPSSVTAPSLPSSVVEEAGTYEVVIDVDEPVDAVETPTAAQREPRHTDRKTSSTLPAQPVDGPQRSPRRRAPSPPSPNAAAPPHRAGDDVLVPSSPPSRSPVQLTQLLTQKSHDDNVKELACYLKAYYACDSAEADRGLETMMPEDVLGLMQCLYVDLYRIVRTLRSSMNMPIHMFCDGDPSESLMIPAPATTTTPATTGAVPYFYRGEDEMMTDDMAASAMTTSPNRSRPTRPGTSVQVVEAKVPPFTRVEMRSRPVQNSHHTPPSPQSSGRHTGIAVRALSPEQALAASPSPPYRAAPHSSGQPPLQRSSPPAVSPRSTTTTPRRRRPEEKMPLTTRSGPSPTRRDQREDTTGGGGGGGRYRGAPTAANSSFGTSVSTSRSASAHETATDTDLETALPPIAKRPLKTLMPLLRRGAYLVKHNSSLRTPHLRWFCVQDCVDAFHGRDVLMPHFTWASSPAEASTLSSDTAFNLVGLESVAVGAGSRTSDKAWKLFKRKRGRVIGHNGKPIPNGMCVVLQFAGKKPLGLSFLSEEERQTWVSALMGVVERNRSIAPKA